MDSDWYFLLAGIVGLVIGVAIGVSLYSLIPSFQQSQSGRLLENMEEIRWTDWKGRERIVKIKREVHG